tara:strand:- start:9742 stop:10431 length:690 start_codon:yes stop_codon:yes gene_type:complete
MSQFEELDYAQTPLGELILRRRRTTRGSEVFEVKLNGEFLMSSLVNDSEVALAEEALNELDGQDHSVVIGGLGLGHTTAAALAFSTVASLTVIEVLHEVIAWHTNRLVPLAARLVGDPRCAFVHTDFFDWLRLSPEDLHHAILVDIDHTPEHLLADTHRSFYEPAGLTRVRKRLHSGGVFALWSGGDPIPEFISKLESVFDSVEARPLIFQNPLLDIEDTNTIYIARKP